MAKPVKRKRPVLTVTLDAEVIARLREAQRLLPGSSLSGIVSELLQMSLPLVEGMIAALREARRDDGTVDDDRAKDSLARWAGAQLLGLDEDDVARGAVGQAQRFTGKEAK
ncbi:MAG: hypothetical protein H3C44_10650 [Ignavibacteria bacterium]|nr:hypothetical protein [Ignavibacteria bacterium]